MKKNVLISFTIFLLLFPFADAQQDEDYFAVLSNGRWCRFPNYIIGREKSSIVFPEFQKDNIPFFSAEWNEDDVKKVMTAVADWQIDNFEKVKHHSLDWTNAALCIGMMSWAKMADTVKYLNWLYHIGQKYHWQPYFRMYNADDLAVTQMYLDMCRLKQENYIIIPTQARLDWVINHPATSSLDFRQFNKHTKDRWSWCDALFMAPPVYVKMYKITGDTKYIQFMDKEYKATYDYLYDKEEHLFYRDSRYFDKLEVNGEKVFWGRGNGWVMAGLVTILKELPAKSEYRQFYETLFKEMSAKIASLQDENGYWHASLLDSKSYPNPETSASSFLCYALAYGINSGLLNQKQYMPTVKKAWTALIEAVYPEGKLGWVQPIGADPKKVTKDMTEVYGVGAFLLAGTEIFKLAIRNDDNTIIIQAKNPLADSRDHEILTFSWSKLSSSIKGLTRDNVAVLDIASTRYLVIQLYKSDDKSEEELLFCSSFGPKETKYFAVKKRPENIVKPTTKEKAFAMFVPQRLDDFAWENDRIAFRMYGPALEKETVSSGIDVWVKSVTYPVIKKRYDIDNYHEDNGDGLDFYKVGQSRGCGGIVITKDGDEFVSRNFRKWKIIANGPIRTVFELYYNPYNVGGIQVKETKRIQLDLGSNMNLIKSSLSWKGNNSLNVRVGISRQDEGGQIKYELKDGILLFWPKANPKYGIVGCGLIVPDAKYMIDDNKNVYLSKKIKQGSTLKYYSGACWNKVKEFNDITKWENYLYHFNNLVNNPIEINYK